jgi:hypothetical protein
VEKGCAPLTGQHQQRENCRVVDFGKTLDATDAHAFAQQIQNQNGIVQRGVHAS